MVGFEWFLLNFGWSLGVLLSGFLDFFVGHNLLMIIDNLHMLKKFWGISPLLNYF